MIDDGVFFSALAVPPSSCESIPPSDEFGEDVRKR
jgi:hypothetical protein